MRFTTGKGDVGGSIALLCRRNQSEEELTGFPPPSTCRPHKDNFLFPLFGFVTHQVFGFVTHHQVEMLLIGTKCLHLPKSWWWLQFSPPFPFSELNIKICICQKTWVGRSMNNGEVILC